jgi:hypothetical protein
MVLLFATKLEKVLGRLPGEPRFLLELPKRRVREMFPALEHSTRQNPLCLMPCDQENPIASAANYRGASLQTNLPLLSLPDAARRANPRPDSPPGRSRFLPGQASFADNRLQRTILIQKNARLGLS